MPVYRNLILSDVYANVPSSNFVIFRFQFIQFYEYMSQTCYKISVKHWMDYVQMKM